MRIGIPVWGSRISPLFDTARTLLLVEVSDNRDVGRTKQGLEQVAAPQRAMALANWSVETLLCGAISRPLAGMVGMYGLDGRVIKRLIKIPLAFFALFKVKPQGQESNQDIPHVDAEIRGLVVLEEERGRGIGTELMRQGFKYLRGQGIQELGLTVSPGNTAARRLYSKLGFVERGTYQESTGQKVYMTKNLSANP